MSVAQRSILFYVLSLLLFGGLIYYAVVQGEQLRPDLTEELNALAGDTPLGTPLEQFRLTLDANMHHALAVLLIQIVAIVAVARLFGYLFAKLGQPMVIGEIVAGIVLGPSVVGYWFPGVFDFLFPQSSWQNLQFMSQIGLVLFMFVIGMELDLKVLGGRATRAVVISHTSIIVLYALGIGLAYMLYLDFAPPTIAFRSFGLFMGIAMSITAFPVLARIIQERGLTRTPVGATALATAASDDVTAWCVLAAVIAIVKAGDLGGALYTIASALVYAIVMLAVLRPFLRRLGEIHGERATISKPVLAMMFLLMLGSAWTTSVIGIHPLFGAFLAGVIMPPNLSFRRILVSKLEDVSLVLLLPLFFAFTGLRTRIGLLNDEDLWWTCALVIGVAVVGKFGAASIAARITGHGWKDSLTIGALMNTRGLMELVVLNIGYDLGVLSAELFAIMVLMALFSTFMTGPALDLIERIFRKPTASNAFVAEDRAVGWRVLIAFGQPESDRRALRLVNQLAGGDRAQARITALHVTPSAEINPIDGGDFECQGFTPLLREAERLGLPVTTEHRVSMDVSREIEQVANSGGYDLLLMGAGKPLLRGTLLGDLLGITTRVIDPSKLIGSITGRETLLPVDDRLDPKVRQLIEGTRCSVGVFLDRRFVRATTVLLPLAAPGDLFLLHYAERLLIEPSTSITLLDPAGLVQREPSFRSGAQRLSLTAPERLTILPDRPIDHELLGSHDLLLTSYAGWVRAAERRAPWLEDVPSTLIMKP
ncbi:MAG: cation:proton antiporter [Flavobacteriales bacterium]|nr:cation:proton antiporter [Flavobacteriales bacterium]